MLAPGVLTPIVFWTVAGEFCCTAVVATCTVIVFGTASPIGDAACWAIAASCDPCRVKVLPSGVTSLISCVGPMVVPDVGILATNAAMLFTGARLVCCLEAAAGWVLILTTLDPWTPVATPGGLGEGSMGFGPIGI